MPGRFSLSFPGRRDRDDPWFRIGTLDVTTAVLVPALCVVSMFFWAFVPELFDTLVLETGAVRRGQAWRLVTWPIATSPESIFTVLLLVMFWYFGRELERMVGRTRFVRLVLLLAVVPGLLATGLGVDLEGLRLIEVTVFCLFCAELPEMRFFGGIPAWVFAAVIIGLEVLQSSGYGRYRYLLVLAATLATAALVARHDGLLGRYRWIPRLGGASGSRRSSGSQRRSGRRQTRQPTTVVAGPWQSPGLSPIEQAELDALLDKTNASGLDSLSRDEKTRLNDLSKKLRGR